MTSGIQYKTRRGAKIGAEDGKNHSVLRSVVIHESSVTCYI